MMSRFYVRNFVSIQDVLKLWESFGNTGFNLGQIL